MQVNRHLKNISILAVGEGVAKLIGFVSTIYLARALGTAGFGVVGFAAALYGYFSLAANPGFELIGTREIAKGSMPPATVISSIFFLRSALAAAAYCVLVCVMVVSPMSHLIRTMVLIQGCNLFLIPFMVQFIFRGKEDMAAVAVSRIVQSLSYLLLVYMFVSSEEHVLHVPVFILAASVVSLLPLNVRVLRAHPLRSFRLDRGAVREIGRQTLRVGGAAILVQLYVSFDTILLGYFRTQHEVGLYTAAYKVVTLLTIFSSLLFQTYLPQLAQEFAAGVSTHYLRQYRAVTIATGLVLGAVSMALAPWLIPWMYGAQYQDAVLPLQILSAAVVMIYCNVASVNPLLARGKDNLYLIIVGTGAFVSLAANIALIPSYGMLAAAATTLLAEAVIFAVTPFVMRKRAGDTIHMKK